MNTNGKPTKAFHSFLHRVLLHGLFLVRQQDESASAEKAMAPFKYQLTACMSLLIFPNTEKLSVLGSRSRMQGTGETSKGLPRVWELTG